jgi:hypothetical protein
MFVAFTMVQTLGLTLKSGLTHTSTTPVFEFVLDRPTVS